MRFHPCGAIAALAAGVVLGAATSAAAQIGPFRPSAGVLTPVQQPRPQQPLLPVPRFNDRQREQQPLLPVPRFNDRQREQAMRELRTRPGMVTPQNVCGMTVVPAPKVDAKAVKKAPEDKKYTMRSLPRTEFGWPASCEIDNAVAVPDTQTGR